MPIGPPTGERAWRFWTIPLRGEKGSETWVGNALEHGCGATWVTGSYDAALGLIYWTVGNPCPDFNGDERKGDNLYTNSVVALDVKTGAMKWYYQFTPHDTHDWDSNGPLILLDEPWEGRPRKLMAHADVNGFFFVLDRTDGKLLLATPLGKQNWTTGYGKDGRPVVTDHFESTFEGTHDMPDRNREMALGVLRSGVEIVLRAGLRWLLHRPERSHAPRDGPAILWRGLRRRQAAARASSDAVDIHTGSKAWEYPLLSGGGGSGTLATAGGLVFFGESGGTFTALDSKTGIPVWHFETGQSWRASPMTYMVGGTQYVVLAGQGGIFSFALTP